MKKNYSFNDFDYDLIKSRSMSGNTFLATEILLNQIKLPPNAKILDLACGKALSSLYIARNTDALIFSVDNTISVNDNFQFLKSEGLEERVTPLACEARNLPFADQFFDAIFCINSISYFGTDDKFVPYIAQKLKKDGILLIFDICLANEVESKSSVPSLLKDNYPNYWYHIHSVEYWKNKFELSSLFDIDVAGEIKQLNLYKDEFIKYGKVKPDVFTETVAKDYNNEISFFNLILKRNAHHPFLEEFDPKTGKPNHSHD